MCNATTYSESGAPIAPTRCTDYILLQSDRDRLAGVVVGMEEQGQRNIEALRRAEARASEGSLACDSCDWMGSVSECKHSEGEAAGRCDCPECGGDAEGAFWWRGECQEKDNEIKVLEHEVSCLSQELGCDPEFDDMLSAIHGLEADLDAAKSSRDANVAMAERLEAENARLTEDLERQSLYRIRLYNDLAGSQALVEEVLADNKRLREALVALRSVVHTVHVDMGGYHRYGISNGSPTGRAIMLADNALKEVG